ncbi:hypothetical protein [Desulfoluna butyratoxydans]|uniref:Uncharacterized protein n=1 Tax=Desulfoluna butyratoxydans TaxID=231438 RepID=A0A4U8YMV8_9BACT|nr:hypothetical protein [Desulfoluna butyratoxydans]VFQ45110.1 hypothetical protein MSL71_27670 [Desulfoluna butyratoxydans]
MRTNRWFAVAGALIVLWATGCGSEDEMEGVNIQKNEASGFTLMDIFEGEGALEEAWDAIDGEMVNDLFADTVNDNPEAFVTFASGVDDLMTVNPTLMPDMCGKDTRGLLGVLMAPSPDHRTAQGLETFYSGAEATDYTRAFYAYLDDLATDVPLRDEGYTNQIFASILGYWRDTDTPEEFLDDLRDMVDTITDPDFDEDFHDFSQIMGKLLIRSDYPMWKDADGTLLNSRKIDPLVHENMGLGNIVAGVHALLMGLDEVMGDEQARLSIHQMINGLGEIFDPGIDTPRMIRDLLCGMEDRLTTGGDVYEADAMYHRHDGEIYSDAELGLGLREVFPYLMQYFLRADREMGMISDLFGNTPYPLGILSQNLHAMQWDIPGARIEESLYDMLRYDIWGRDRLTDPEAFHTSFLENLMFFAALGAHTGYDDGGKTGEITDSGNPNYDHGHGKGCGTLTVNDTLFAMTTHKTLGMGMYDIALQSKDYKYMFRGRAPFYADGPEMDDYRFRYDQNYPIGLMVAGTPGDMGSPQGGRPRLEEDGTPVLNGYRPYGATGVEDDNIALNTMSASVRAAWHAEGPYYYVPKTPKTVTFHNRIWQVTHTPGGLVYAWIHKPSADPANWEYLYPAQFEGQTMEEQASLAVQYGVPTHALFTSDIDLKDGIDNSIWTGRKLEILLGPDSRATIDFDKSQKYFRDDIVSMINEAFGEAVCFPHDEGGGEYLHIVSDCGPIHLDNAAYNPLGAFFKHGAGLLDDIDVAVEAFRVSGDATVSIAVDSGPPVPVAFENPSRTWTANMVMDRLRGQGLTVRPFGTGVEILGVSPDPDIGRIEVTDVSGCGVVDFFGGASSTITGYLHRMEHYKDVWRSDYYLGKLGGTYYTVGYDASGNLAMPEVQSGEEAGSLIVNELIGDNDPVRECASHEEALFRNYQFFFAERKFVLVMPIHVTVLGSEAAFIFQVMEANGYTGFMNGRKYLGNQVWAKKRAHGPSELPGDYRMCIRVISEGLIGSIAVTEESVYNDTIDCGVAFNAIFPHNSPVIYRMGFPRAPLICHGTDAEGNPVTDALVGSREFEVGDEIWQNRNAVLVILQALWGSLHRHTEVGYESTRGGMLSFFDMMAYLLKPLFYYQKDAGQWPHECWKPRLIDGRDFLYPSADFYDEQPMATWYGSEEERGYYRPAKVQTLITLLTDSDPYGEKNPDGTPLRCDGLLARMTEYDLENGPARSRLLTGLFAFLQRLGDPAFDDASSPACADETNAACERWGPRRDILFGLEQIVSAVRMTKAPATALNEAKNIPIVFPPWLFAQGDLDAPTHLREEDLLLDWGIDLIVGEDETEEEEGRGLADYPDDKLTDADWDELYDTVHLLEGILHPGSPHSITANLLGLLDSVMAKPTPCDSFELAGTLYALGRLFARYDAEKDQWIHQGDEGFDDLYNLIKHRFPEIHAVLDDDTGITYHAFLVILADLLKEKGLVECLVDDVTIPSGWDKILTDLNAFLGKPVITEHDPLWSTLASLLGDLAHAVDLARDVTLLWDVYEKYGLQVNE